MKKKVIALADNSYTIRRIVELSFSEIENIEVHSFENGSGIKEKLLKMEPDVVIVDIKLPEINGYDVCRFMNETPSLSHSRIFLMKGSFEAVDNEMIKNLKYEDIVTKPFDSNALVNAVMKTLNQDEQKIAAEFPEEEPSSFPEDIIEIETDSREAENINFSDIRLDFEAPLPGKNVPPPNQILERDEILPSEEITQGTQPLKDTLMAPETEEPIQNPFNEEPLLENVKLPADEVTAPMVTKPGNGPAVQKPQAETLLTDVADEFHGHFQEVVNEDTSEALAQSSLEKTRMADMDSLKFPIDREDEIFTAGRKEFAAAGPEFQAGAPKKTMFSEKDEIFDSLSTSQNPNKGKGSEARLEKMFDEELFVQKIRPEVISPEAELEKLSQTPQKEMTGTPPVEHELPLKGKMDLSGKLEDKLTLTIKELLWEIVPSLAEKIIKEEIDKIKAEANGISF